MATLTTWDARSDLELEFRSASQRQKRKLLSRVRLFATPWTIQSMGFSRPEYWSGEPFSSPGDLPNPGIEPRSPTLPADSLPAEPSKAEAKTQIRARAQAEVTATLWGAKTTMLLISRLHREISLTATLSPTLSERAFLPLFCPHRHPSHFSRIISLRLRWVFVAASGLSPVLESGELLSRRGHSLSLRRPPLLRTPGARF